MKAICVATRPPSCLINNSCYCKHHYHHNSSYFSFFFFSQSVLFGYNRHLFMYFFFTIGNFFFKSFSSFVICVSSPFRVSKYGLSFPVAVRDSPRDCLVLPVPKVSVNSVLCSLSHRPCPEDPPGNGAGCSKLRVNPRPPSLFPSTEDNSKVWGVASSPSSSVLQSGGRGRGGGLESSLE